MGGSFGGMMWRVASSLGMGGSRMGYSDRPRDPDTWADKVLESTENTLEKIQDKHCERREEAIENFRRGLEEIGAELQAAKLVKEGDTLYKIMCRGLGVKFKKPKTRKSR